MSSTPIRRPASRYSMRRGFAGGVAALLVGIGMVPAAMTTAQAAEPVMIPDDDLLACVNDELGQADDAIVTVSQASGLASLECRNLEIEDLTGIEAMTGLTSLTLNGNTDITDVGPLAALTDLNYLSLQNMDLEDVDAIAGLTKLTDLRLNGNRLTDLDAVANLVNLTTLIAFGNSIMEDISGVQNLTSLTSLSLYHNEIGEITALSGLTDLEDLRLSSNNVTDVSPLAGLSKLNMLTLNNNAIANVSALSTLSPSEMRLHDQTVNLGDLDVGTPVDNPVVGLNGDALALDDHYDAATNSLTPTFLGNATASWSAGTDPHDFSGVLRFTGVEPPVPSPIITIEDPNLVACINDELGQGPNDDITEAQAAGVTELECDARDIETLSGLEHFTSLDDLDIEGNQVSDLSPLAGLSDLGRLSAYRNQISDLGPVATVTSLTSLDLGSNQISDVTPLAGFSEFNLLMVDGNHIADVSPLGAIDVVLLWLDDQQIDLGDVLVGAALGNPVIGLDGTPVPLSDLYDAGTNTLTPEVEGDGIVTWLQHSGDAEFSGTLSFFGVLELSDQPDVGDQSGDEDTETGSAGSAAEGDGEAEESTQAAGVLPSTGAFVGSLAVVVALALVGMGAVMLNGRKPDTLAS